MSDANTNLDPDAANATGKKIKLITVHGTGAGDTSPTGDKWWQLGSAFLREFQKRIDLDPARVEVVPFQWDDGPNSEHHRRVAGRNLYKQVLDLEKAGTDYHLIGHSHGGSVIYNMLLHSVKKKQPLEHMKQWCTVGTPFLDYQKNRFMYQRLKGFGLTVFSSGLVAFLLGFTVLAVLGYYVATEGIDILSKLTAARNIGTALFVVGLAILLLLRMNERRGHTWFDGKQKARANEMYSGSWLGLWHQEDEAISALSNIKNVSGAIIPSTFLQPFVAIVQIVIVLLFGLAFLLEIFDASGDVKVLDTAFMLVTGQDKVDYDTVSAVQSFQVISLLFGGLILFVSIVTLVLKILARLFGILLAPAINRVIWVSVRERAWGDDLLKEAVHSAKSHPPGFEQQFCPLPSAIDTPLKAHSDGHAISTLNKVRLILGMASDSASAPDLKTELNEALKWKELIHTSYFDVPEFIDLLAIGMNPAGLGDLRDGFQGDESARAEMVDWLNTARVFTTGQKA